VFVNIYIAAKMSKLSPTEAKAIGEARESWCAVEMKKEQSWCRKERKHHQDQFTSCVFDEQKSGYQPRCTFEIDAPTHRERRHNREQSKIIFPFNTKAYVCSTCICIPFYSQGLPVPVFSIARRNH
jgi:hypothetical protein